MEQVELGGVAFALCPGDGEGAARGRMDKIYPSGRVSWGYKDR
jgi:hypothetical protein